MQLFGHLFEKKNGNGVAAANPHLTAERYARHSGGWAALRKRLLTEADLRIIDIGYTSPTNINTLTGLGHSVFLADLVEEAHSANWVLENDEDGKPVWDTAGYIERTLQFSGRTFDAVLLWTSLDYLPEPLVEPVVNHLFEAMNPGGQVLAFFHTRMQGEETTYCRFHITSEDDVLMQPTYPYPIRRAFSNRSIERLFSAWSAHKQFLAKDSLSEVIITR